MIQIQPYITTDQQLTATQLDISNLPETDAWVVIVWTLYDALGAYIDTGNYTLTGDDLAAWQADSEYGETYVMNQKGISLLNH